MCLKLPQQRKEGNKLNGEQAARSSGVLANRADVGEITNRLEALVGKFKV
ncbi:MAG: hypothetical protein LLG02_10890 [Pelosinus sp.]|nr:hypothetical protein [Pelosinus sp.]